MRGTPILQLITAATLIVGALVVFTRVSSIGQCRDRSDLTQ
jgi:hypothetical protein